MAEVKKALHTFNDLRVGGKIARLTRARKEHQCTACDVPIEKGTDYYCVYTGGAGLGDVKFPSRYHIDCLEGFNGGKTCP